MHSFFSRLTSPRRALHVLPGFLVLMFAVWNLLFFFLKPGGFTPEDLLPGYSMLGFVAVGYMELYLNLYRGFSYTLIAEVAESPEQTEDQIRHGFADGTGDRAMIERRFGSMERARLIRRDQHGTHILPRGRFFGRISQALRNFLHLEPGGG